MSVSNGQLANATTFNGAFVSRSAVQTVAGGKQFTDFVSVDIGDVASTATITALTSAKSGVRITGSTVTSIQGITAGSYDGQLLCIFNDASVNVTLEHENGSATSANRILLPSSQSQILGPQQSAVLIYSTGDSRWAMLSASNHVSINRAETISGGKTFASYLSLDREDVASAATIAALSSSKPFVKITGATATTIQGIVAGVNGQTITIFNGSTQQLTVAHQNLSASASDRIKLPGSSNASVQADSSIELIYDGAQSRWVQKSGSGSGSGGAGIAYTMFVDDLAPFVNFFETTGKVYNFTDEDTQYLYASFKTPSTYVAGRQLRCTLKFYGSGSNNATFTMRSVKQGGGSATDSETFAVSLGADFYTVSFDITDTGGLIGGNALAANDMVFLRWTRDTDTNTSIVGIVDNSMEIITV